MLYVLLALVVFLAIVCGVEFAMLKCANAEHKAKVYALKYAHLVTVRKLESYKRLDNVKEGLE